MSRYPNKLQPMREVGGGQKSCSEVSPSSFSAEKKDLIIRANCYRDDQSNKKFSWQLCLPPHSPSGYLGAGDILFGKSQQVLPCHLCSPPSLLYSSILKHSEALNVATQDHNNCRRTSLFLVGLIVAGNRVYSWKELRHKHFIL